MARLLDWGKSMYGGYYAQFMLHGRLEYRCADKLAELRFIMSEYGIKLQNCRRFDNI